MSLNLWAVLSTGAHGAGCGRSAWPCAGCSRGANEAHTEFVLPVIWKKKRLLRELSYRVNSYCHVWIYRYIWVMKFMGIS